MGSHRLLQPLLVALALTMAGPSPLQAAPAWTAEDDAAFVQNFVRSYSLRTGTKPSEQLVTASLQCHRHYYNQAAAAGYDVNAAANYSLASCANSQPRVAGSGSAGSGSGTIFNSSGDSSLSTDSNGCLYYSSGPYSFSNC
ncbi:MAG: hypothetical protein VKO65_01260 [Cyanobacteriota bacterium]|nr:hypothetical protein [Cyanobacteriota bacterium]